eukprot:2468429-Rhodomonas_salina.2
MECSPRTFAVHVIELVRVGPEEGGVALLVHEQVGVVDLLELQLDRLDEVLVHVLCAHRDRNRQDRHRHTDTQTPPRQQSSSQPYAFAYTSPSSPNSSFSASHARTHGLGPKVEDVRSRV